jgi:tetratricopeptide (TPR) repeat protein
MGRHARLAAVILSLLMLVVPVLLGTGRTVAQKAEKDSSKAEAVRLTGFGDAHHRVSTRNPEAQAFFDQGLRLMYAFNHDEAARAFRQAARLDPSLAMAHWGVALALGPNINAPVDAAQEKAAYEAVQKAVNLAAGAAEHERAYIEALAVRYSADPKADLKKLAVDYKEAMGRLARRYPDDLDAATLYAESMMDLRPWQLWSKDGKPAEGTEELVAVLESVLRRNPNHTGANHYYIHAVEASLHPERALPSAARLGALAPAAGHLVHMPSHIYIRVGDYAEAARCNATAAAADEAYFQKARCSEGIYPMMYYSHNLHFLAVAHAMQGRYADAKAAADKLVEHVKQHVEEMPMLEGFLPMPVLVLARFKRWDDILNIPAPPAEQKLVAAARHFARGLALAATGRVEDAANERKALYSIKTALPEKAMYSPLNPAQTVLTIAVGVLDAQLALARADNKAALAALQGAVQAEDALAYAEPADWSLPVREMLGGLLMRTGDHVAAEQVFRDDLTRNPRSGRSLLGLSAALKAQGKTYTAELVEAEFEAAWKNADVQLKVEDL